MAERRMFAKTIIDSDAFLDMPLSTHALYFHLSMRADDDGFINNPKKIQRMIGASDDDLKMLVVNKFIIPFESGIVVIKHWKIHNYIRGDRKKETVYPREMSMLTEKENGAYSLKSVDIIEGDEPKLETTRQKAYRESSLPYSFEYKIRQAFYGEKCPICGFDMRGSVDECGISSNNRNPSIQHNIPISKGGKHELGNISVICRQCNITLQDTETGELNSKEVIKRWDEISSMNGCQTIDRQLTDNCRHRIVEDSIEENSIDKDKSAKKRKVFTAPKYEEVLEYAKEKGREDIAKEFYDYFTVGEWVDSQGNKVRNWKQKFLTWCGKNAKKPDDKPAKPRYGTFDATQAMEDALKRNFFDED